MGSACSGRPSVADGDASSVSAAAVVAVNRTGMELLQALLPSNPGSIFISPVSLALALAMTASGARGATQAGILRSLCAEKLGGAGPFGKQLQSLSAALASSDPGVAFHMANAMWSTQLTKGFVKLCRQTFNAEARVEEPRAERVNSWCDKCTQGAIPKLLPPGMPLDPKGAVLTNALFFKGCWQETFDESETRDATFRGAGGASPCKMMAAKSSDKKFLYRETDIYQAAVLPYGKGDNYSSLVVLPRAGGEATLKGMGGPGGKPLPGAAAKPRAASLEKVLAAMPKEWSSLSVSTGMVPTKGSLSLPRFRAEFGAGLTELLASRGMAAAFSDGADFGDMTDTPGIRVSAVVHKTFVEVDEAGTKAAAATAVVLSRGLDLSPSFSMVCDRPFLFFVRHDTTKAVLFAGAVRAI